MQTFVLKKSLARRKKLRDILTIRDVKMLTVILYYIIVGVMGLITITYSEIKAKPNRDHLVELFGCESTGSQDCSDVNLNTLDTLNELNVVVISMIAFLPIVAVLFSFKIPKKCCKKRTTSSYRVATR